MTTSDFLLDFAEGYDEEKVAAGSNPMATFAYPEMEVTEDLINQAKREQTPLSMSSAETQERERTEARRRRAVSRWMERPLRLEIMN